MLKCVIGFLTNNASGIDLIIQHEFYKELLAKTTDERNIEEDIHLSSEEAAEEKVYE